MATVPDIGVADLVDDALAILYESGARQLLHDLIARSTHLLKHPRALPRDRLADSGPGPCSAATNSCLRRCLTAIRGTPLGST
jgi:hypothetical protein